MFRFFLLFFIISLNAAAQNDTLIKQLFKKADIVAHVKIDNVPWNKVPMMVQEMGTNWYYPHFSTIKIYRKTLSHDYQHFGFVCGYTGPDSTKIKPGKDYFVFLKCGISSIGNEFSGQVDCDNSTGTLILMDGGIFEYDRKNRRMILAVVTDPFYKAVSKGKWKKAEGMIRNVVKENRNGTLLPQGYTVFNSQIKKIEDWLNSQPCVAEALTDNCAIHIAIYPGWSDIGVRFITNYGLKEKCVTISEGKVRKHGYIWYCLGLRTYVNRLFYKGMSDSPGFIEQEKENCRRLIAEHERQINDSKISFSMEIIPSALSASGDPLFEYPEGSPVRLKVRLTNNTDAEQHVLWTYAQNDFDKIVSFGFIDEKGRLIHEKDKVIRPVNDDTPEPYIHTIEPHDYIEAFHTVNDPFCSSTDERSAHPFNLGPGKYSINSCYKPTYLGLHDNNYWKPLSDSIQITAMGQITITNRITGSCKVKVKLLDGRGKYINKWGANGIYNGVAEIKEGCQDINLNPGDLIAYKFNNDFEDVSGLPFPFPPPAMEQEIIKAGDVCMLMIDTSVKPDEIAWSAFPLKPKRVFLLVNRTDAVKRLE